MKRNSALVPAIFLLGALPGTPSIVHAQQVSQPTSSDIGDIQPADPNKFYKKPGYSPYAGKHYPERPLFGDEHVHTAWSVDAGLSGATLDPVAAVRFARGEQVTSASGQPVRLSRPLDWVAVTDHSDAMGTVAAIREGNPEMMRDPTLKRWHDMMNAGLEEGSKATFELVAAQSNKKLPAALTDPKWAKTFWEHNTAIMEQYNQPGRFTAFIAYEWTSNAGGGDNLHRNVIYRDDKKLADQVLPMTTFASENPEDLWKWMADWEKKTGGKLLAIPHNGNLSNGRMFELRMFLGGAMTKDWAQQRQQYEPLFEAIQMKGQSESHPSLSVTDEFAVGLRAVGPRQSEHHPEEARHDRARIPAPGSQGGTQGRAAARRESLQVRHGRRHRYSQFPDGCRRGQFFRQVRQRRAASGSLERGRDEVQWTRHQGLGNDGRWLYRRVGDGEHARRHLGWNEASRDVRDQRSAHDCAVLRRLRLRAAGCDLAQSRDHGLHEGNSDGRRSEEGARRARHRRFSSRPRRIR
jgi:hypothetical protein